MEMKTDEPGELNIVVDDVEDRAKDDHFADESQNINVHGEKTMFFTKNSDVDVVYTISSRRDEEETIKKKYGGLMAKKHPLISKDHEKAFFDSADWALNQQGSQKSKGPLEVLRPKLEPSPHQLPARSAYARLDDSEVDGERNADIQSSDQSRKLDFTEVENNATADQR